jgi:hypothetical protein
MPTPDNSLPTDVELREANFIFHEMNPEELREELEHGAKYVKFVVVRAQWACNVILMKSWVSPAIAIRDIPDCMAIWWGEIHEVEKKDVKSLPSLYRTRPMTPDLMRIVSQRISRYLK